MNNNDDQKNLPAEQSPPREETRISLEDGNQERSRSDCASPGKRSQTLDSASLLNISETTAEIVSTKAPENASEKTLEQIDGTYPKTHRLRKPAEFQRVYKNGKRFDARFVTAFVLPNNLKHHRLGITASRKAVGNAVQRNRAKRLLREAFRLSKAELNRLETKYDFVLNARRNLLKVKMREPLEDFQKLIAHVARYENARKILANNETAPNVNLTHE